MGEDEQQIEIAQKSAPTAAAQHWRMARVKVGVALAASELGATATPADNETPLDRRVREQKVAIRENRRRRREKKAEIKGQLGAEGVAGLSNEERRSLKQSPLYVELKALDAESDTLAQGLEALRDAAAALVIAASSADDAHVAAGDAQAAVAAADAQAAAASPPSSTIAGGGMTGSASAPEIVSVPGLPAMPSTPGPIPDLNPDPSAVTPIVTAARQSVHVCAMETNADGAWSTPAFSGSATAPAFSPRLTSKPAATPAPVAAPSPVPAPTSADIPVVAVPIDAPAVAAADAADSAPCVFALTLALLPVGASKSDAEFVLALWSLVSRHAGARVLIIASDTPPPPFAVVAQALAAPQLPLPPPPPEASGPARAASAAAWRTALAQRLPLVRELLAMSGVIGAVCISEVPGAQAAPN